MGLGSLVNMLVAGIMRIGLPIVAVYHLISGSVFLNMAVDEAPTIERVADVALIPFQYLFAGYSVHQDAERPGQFQIHQRFDYHDHFLLKTSGAVAALPLSVTIGSALKAIAYCLPATQHYHTALNAYLRQPALQSHNDQYRALGMDVRPLETAEELTTAPRYERGYEEKDHLKDQKEALRAIVSLLKQHDIVHWVDCGTCLGAYRYRGVIPWDEDIDLAILLPDFENVLHVLKALPADRFVVQDWSSRDHPHSYIRVYVKSAHWHIDIYHYAIDTEQQAIQYFISFKDSFFLPRSWKIREERCAVPTPFDVVFPLRRCAFEDFEVYVPNQIETYLQLRYGADLRPAKLFNPITNMYEQDPTHPYWQLPHAR